MTEAEKALLDAVLRGCDHAEVEPLLAAVRVERVKPGAKEAWKVIERKRRAIHAEMTAMWKEYGMTFDFDLRPWRHEVDEEDGHA